MFFLHVAVTLSLTRTDYVTLHETLSVRVLTTDIVNLHVFPFVDNMSKCAFLLRGVFDAFSAAHPLDVYTCHIYFMQFICYSHFLDIFIANTFASACASFFLFLSSSALAVALMFFICMSWMSHFSCFFEFFISLHV